MGFGRSERRQALQRRDLLTNKRHVQNQECRAPQGRSIPSRSSEKLLNGMKSHTTKASGPCSLIANKSADRSVVQAQNPSSNTGLALRTLCSPPRRRPSRSILWLPHPLLPPQLQRTASTGNGGLMSEMLQPASVQWALQGGQRLVRTLECAPQHSDQQAIAKYCAAPQAASSSLQRQNRRVSQTMSG